MCECRKNGIHFILYSIDKHKYYVIQSIGLYRQAHTHTTHWEQIKQNISMKSYPMRAIRVGWSSSNWISLINVSHNSMISRMSVCLCLCLCVELAHSHSANNTWFHWRISIKWIRARISYRISFILSFIRVIWYRFASGWYNSIKIL